MTHQESRLSPHALQLDPEVALNRQEDRALVEFSGKSGEHSLSPSEVPSPLPICSSVLIRGCAPTPLGSIGRCVRLQLGGQCDQAKLQLMGRRLCGNQGLELDTRGTQSGKVSQISAHLYVSSTSNQCRCWHR